jgi:hypothetical protein
LVEVVKRHGKNADECRAVYFTTPFGAFEKRVVVDIASKTLSATYLWGLFLTIFIVQTDLQMRGVSENVEVMFGDNKTFGRKAKMLYPLIRDGIGRKSGTSFPSDVLFKDDKEFLPRQLSDMLAWLLRRAWNGQRNDFEWILDELKSVIKISPHSLMLCEQNIDRLMAIEGMGNVLPIPQDVLDKWEAEVGRDAISSLTRSKKAKRR